MAEKYGARSRSQKGAGLIIGYRSCEHLQTDEHSSGGGFMSIRHPAREAAHPLWAKLNVLRALTSFSGHALPPALGRGGRTAAAALPAGNLAFSDALTWPAGSVRTPITAWEDCSLCSAHADHGTELSIETYQDLHTTITVLQLPKDAPHGHPIDCLAAMVLDIFIALRIYI